MAIPVEVRIVRFLGDYRKMSPEARLRAAAEVAKLKRLLEERLETHFMTALYQAIQLGQVSEDGEWIKKMAERAAFIAKGLDDFTRLDLRPLFMTYLGRPE